MRIIEAETFAEGFKQFTGGYWAEIVVPVGNGDVWEITPVRPDGSLCESRYHVATCTETEAES